MAANMKRYWLTVHWPPFDDPDYDADNPYVWIVEGRERAATEMRKGDLVAVYESKTGPPWLMDDGKWLRCREGAQAVVWHGRVTGFPTRRVEARVYWRYGELYPIKWMRWANLKVLGRGGLGREEVNAVLGYKRNYVLRGFGRPAWSGIREITQDEFEQITRTG